MIGQDTHDYMLRAVSAYNTLNPETIKSPDIALKLNGVEIGSISFDGLLQAVSYACETGEFSLDEYDQKIWDVEQELMDVLTSIKTMEEVYGKSLLSGRRYDP